LVRIRYVISAGVFAVDIPDSLVESAQCCPCGLRGHFIVDLIASRGEARQGIIDHPEGASEHQQGNQR
jgi:hypothetical protein